MQIDYVITWVDGQDARHKASRRFYRDEEKRRQKFLLKTAAEQTAFETQTKLRYEDNGEIYYNIASTLLYAPFIRRIFIVTDGQIPPLLNSFIEEGKCRADFIRLVSHDEIFKADRDFPNLRAARPSFNSLSIEAVLWRIPDLSEHFIYGNDDLFFNTPVTEQDFYHDGLPVLYGRWRHSFRFVKNYILRSLAEKLHIREAEADFTASLWRGAYIAAKFEGGGMSRFWAAGHNLHPLRKSVFAEFFSKYPDILNKQLSFRFRDLRQFNPVSLANNLEIMRGDKPADGEPGAYFDDRKISGGAYEKFLGKLRDSRTLYGCIQGMGLYPPHMRAELHTMLTEKFSASLPPRIRQFLLECD